MLRSYEDNGDAVNNLVVIVQPTDKKTIEDFGNQEKFLESVSYLLGKQAYSGRLRSPTDAMERGTCTHGKGLQEDGEIA